MFPRGTPSMAMRNFPNLLPAAETFRTNWKIARVSLHDYSFSEKRSPSRSEASKQLSQLVAVLNCDLHGNKCFTKRLFVPHFSVLPSFSLCISGDHRFYRLLHFPRVSMSSLVCYSCPLCPNGKVCFPR